MNKRHYEHTLPNIRGSLSNTYGATTCRDSNRSLIYTVYFNHSLCFVVRQGKGNFFYDAVAHYKPSFPFITTQ